MPAGGGLLLLLLLLPPLFLLGCLLCCRWGVRVGVDGREEAEAEAACKRRGNDACSKASSQRSSRPPREVAHA
jgi:hypothetical protein